MNRILSLLNIFLFLCSFTYAEKPEIDLGQFERKVYSQNGEDGVIDKIFQVIGATNKSYVEFGVENGHECNTRYLREVYKWNGLLMDMGYDIPAINLHRERITAENINDLFQKYQVPQELDLLSIDIDFNDFHIWNAIKEYYRPRVVIIEYNPSLLPTEDKVIGYNPNWHWDKTNYYGASILSLYKLGRKKGYSLIYADKNGVNLFFVRDDVLESCPLTFKNTNVVEKIYNPPGPVYGNPSGHRRDPYNRPYVSADDLLNN